MNYKMSIRLLIFVILSYTALVKAEDEEPTDA